MSKTETRKTQAGKALTDGLDILLKPNSQIEDLANTPVPTAWGRTNLDTDQLKQWSAAYSQWKDAPTSKNLATFHPLEAWLAACKWQQGTINELLDRVAELEAEIAKTRI